MVERVLIARDTGIDAIYVGDHHGVPEGYVQNNVILGRLAAEWRGKLGAIYLLPLWNPVLLAEQVGTLAEVVGGEFVLQAALGDGESQFVAMGVELRDRVTLFERNLDVIRGLLAGEEVDAGSGPVRIAPVSNVRFWVAGHSGPALARAAERASGWVAGPGLTTDEAAELAVRYRELCAALGKAPGDVAIRRDVFIGDDGAEARAARDAAAQAGYRGFDPDVLVAGDPSQVADAIDGLGAAGFTEVVVRQFAPRQEQALASLARLVRVREAMSG
jgi:alkanesulfonate monooxygenase SsuD/methylene tetrahydromethanopterin reductase-like flavin-dependent oxidoreductase (luciferase family)